MREPESREWGTAGNEEARMGANMLPVCRKPCNSLCTFIKGKQLSKNGIPGDFGEHKNGTRSIDKEIRPRGLALKTTECRCVVAHAESHSTEFPNPFSPSC